MLQKIDKDRLDKVLKVIENSKIKFPVATIARELGRGKGEVSSYLNGKKPMSGNFYKTFLDRYDNKGMRITGDVGEEISRLIDVTIHQQASINVLLQTISEVSGRDKEMEAALISGQLRQAVKIEEERLRGEYAKTL